MGSVHRCQKCGEMLVDVLGANGVVRRSCPCVEPLLLQDVVRQLFVPKQVEVERP